MRILKEPDGEQHVLWCHALQMINTAADSEIGITLYLKSWRTREIRRMSSLCTNPRQHNQERGIMTVTACGTRRKKPTPGVSARGKPRGFQFHHLHGVRWHWIPELARPERGMPGMPRYACATHLSILKAVFEQKGGRWRALYPPSE